MDGSIFRVVRVRLCGRCRRVTWQPADQDCLLCQKGAATSA